jgi:hypothetical protein
MTIDIPKVCDKINWVFLRLALLQIGLIVQYVAVQVNGSPSSFIGEYRGLR